MYLFYGVWGAWDNHFCNTPFGCGSQADIMKRWRQFPNYLGMQGGLDCRTWFSRLRLRRKLIRTVLRRKQQKKFIMYLHSMIMMTKMLCLARNMKPISINVLYSPVNLAKALKYNEIFFPISIIATILAIWILLVLCNSWLFESHGTQL